MLDIIKTCVVLINTKMMEPSVTINENIPCVIGFSNKLAINRKVEKSLDTYIILIELQQELANFYSLPLLLSIIVIFNFSLSRSYYFFQDLVVENYFAIAIFVEIISWSNPLFWITSRVTAILNEVCLYECLFCKINLSF